MVALAGGLLALDTLNAVVGNVKNVVLQQSSAGRSQGSAEVVAGEVQDSQSIKLTQSLGNGSGQLVIAGVKDGKVLDAVISRKRSGQFVAKEENLLDVLHVSNALGDGSVELVVGQRQVNDRGRANVARNAARELVVVQEEDFEVEVESLLGDRPGELVEAQIEEGQIEVKDTGWEGTGKLVVADVDFP